MCHCPDGHATTQTLYTGGWPTGERKGLSQLPSSLRPSPKQATSASAAVRKYCALDESTEDASHDTCPVHPDLNRHFKCTGGNHQPHKTRFDTKTALQVPLLQMYVHIQNMHTHNYRLCVTPLCQESIY